MSAVAEDIFSIVLFRSVSRFLLLRASIWGKFDLCGQMSRTRYTMIDTDSSVYPVVFELLLLLFVDRSIGLMYKV